MLQRAANNAYSWWWASHIRTKQSKWLEQNLQDMEDKVGSVLKLIEEDGDSFRKRAEMYYKKRPELINFVEESFRAYRALAERYDHISKELQNANNTIATVFPERVQFGMEDDDDIDVSPGFRKRLPESFKTDVPKDLKLPVADFKGLVAAATKKFELKNPSHVATGGKVSTSGLSKQEGLEEIDKLQRRILALQTEKEFVTNMYESSVAKYWELEKEVEELQDKVSSLQDEFGAGSVIEDDEARNLMAGAALKSCREALGELQEKQEKSAKEAKLQFKRIGDAREKLDSLRDELLPNEVDQEKPSSGAGPVRTEEELKILEQEAVIAAEARNDLESLRRKIKEHFEVELGGCLTVSQMADKIDELVSKVGSLETAVSSQTAQIQGLKTETDDLHAQIQTLEDDKATLLDGKNELSDKLRKKEEEWNELQELKRRVEEENCNLQTRLTEAHCNLEHLSEKLPGVQLDEEPEAVGKSGKSSLPETDPSGKDAALDSKEDLKENDSLITSKNQTEASLEQQETTEKHASVPSVQTADNLPRFKEKESGVREHKDAPVGTSGKEDGVIFGRQGMDDRHVSSGFVDNYPKVSQEELVAVRLRQGNANERDCTSRNESEGSLEQGTTDKRASIEIQDNVPHDRLQESAAGLEDEPDWRHLFLNGVNDKEKVLLSEYTAVLRDYKETKKVLTQLEARNQTSLLEITVQLKDLKNENSLKELEILHLRQKLKLLQEEIGQSCQCNCHRASSLMNRQCAESTVACEQPDMVTNPKMQSTEDEEEMVIPLVKPRTSSPTEEKFRMAIDKLLEENLDFWLRFSTSFSLIQKFDTEVIDLRAEVSKLEERHKQEGSSTSKYSLKTDVRPIYKHLREVQTELALWVEKSVLQKEELKQRSASLRNMQEEIMKAMKQSAEDDEFTFTSYQVAKFQGEILNMKQENNKVAKELQAGLDHVKTLLLEVERALARMAEEFGLSGSKGNSHLQPGATRSRIPLRTFIFGVKEKKSRSIFSFVHPALHWKNNPWR